MSATITHDEEIALEIPQEDLSKIVDQGKTLIDNLSSQYEEEFTKLLEENQMLRQRIAELESR